MVNLEWYRTFKAIYQQGNLTKAAQDLMISQPNVSVHLAALENYVGGLLFERLPRKMVPTELGKQLYTQVIGSVENLESLEYTFKKSALHKHAIIKLGTPKEFFHAVLTSSIARADSKISISFGLTKELMQDMEKGIIDFVIATHKTIENKHIIYEPILKETFVIVGNAGLDLTSFHKSLKASDYGGVEKWLMEQDWFAYSSDLAFIRRFWLKNFHKRPLVNPKFILPDLNSIAKSISKGTGVGIISDYLLSDYLKQGTVVKIWEGTVLTSNTLYLAYDKSKVSPQKIAEIKALIPKLS